MRNVIFYTRGSFLDLAFSRLPALSRHVQVRTVIEVAPESRQCALMTIPADLPVGLVDADAALASVLPPSAQGALTGVGPIHFAVHTSRHATNPGDILTGWRIGKHLCSLQPDLVHFDDLGLRTLPTIAALGQVPFIVSIHDPLPHSGEASWRTQFCRRFALRRAQHVLLHNEAQHAKFSEVTGFRADRVSVTRLGVYNIFRSYAAAERRTGPPTMLFFGRLSPYKGLDVLYEAAPAVARMIPGVRLVVAGRPIAGYTPPSPPQLPNGGQIILHLDYVPPEKQAQLFQQATLVVCPYLDATQSGVILTAYGFERPVVASAVGGIPEYVSHGATGLLVPPANSKALAESLIVLLSDEAQQEKMRCAIAQLERGSTSWEQIAARIAALYDKVLTGAPVAESAVVHNQRYL